MIKLDFTKNKTYYVVGLGKSNQTVIKALQKAGADIRLWDDNAAAMAPYDDSLIRSIDKAPWSKIKAVIVAPGIAPSHDIVQTAKDKGVPVICDVDLLFQAAPQTKMIGITGTNGKSTVTALIHHILNAEGKAQMGGNIGEPALTLKSRMAYTILELSSYQLEYTPNLALEIGILLNISADHLQWHETMDNYAAAKAKILNNAQTKIISIDDSYSKAIYDQQGQDESDKVIALSIYDDDLPLSINNFPRLKGDHNKQNILAAYQACRVLGLDHDVIIERIQSFEGLNHRQFHVRTINGIPYINDSKATNAEATKYALKAYRNIIWIAGGRAKDGGLEDVDGHLSTVQKAILYGEAANDFAKFLSVRGIAVETCTTMDQAVAIAHKNAQDLRGEPTGSPTLLLSPAAASFDQFDNFEQRGDHFAALVRDLDDE